MKNRKLAAALADVKAGMSRYAAARKHKVSYNAIWRATGGKAGSRSKPAVKAQPEVSVNAPASLIVNLNGLGTIVAHMVRAELKKLLAGI